MGNQEKHRIEYNNLSKDDAEFIVSTILGYTNDTYTLKEINKTKEILEAMDEKIDENDKKIERLLKLIEYMDVTNEKSNRVFIESVASICLGLSVFGIDQMPPENKLLIAAMVGGLAHFGFRQFHDSTNEKILEILYKKLDKIAKENGKLKGNYRDLDEKLTYFEEIESGNYIVLS